MTSIQRLVRPAVMTFVGFITIASASYAAQPPDVVSSDSSGNTAMGQNALLSLSSGADNTASGYGALYSNTTGNWNTASGYGALYANTTGSYNTAFGPDALFYNTTGSTNTAYGLVALLYNTTGNSNTASGYGALYANSTGSDNTASGSYALVDNTLGASNSAFGYAALHTNTTGNLNTAMGNNALYHNTTGTDNTAVGRGALYDTTTGHNNMALGQAAGGYVTTGSNNIEIGNLGTAADNGLIRIGTQGAQTAAFLAGVSGAHVTGAAVYVTAGGQLGVLASSERYKTAVAPMGSSTKRVMQLRPVSFHLKTDPAGEVQYGLIAEEVARVYPELVIRDDKGRIEGVRYEELAPMLLNELQKQDNELQKQDNKLQKQAKVIDALTARLSKVEEQQAHGSGVTDSH